MRFWERNYIFFKCYLNLLFWIFLYYLGHIEDVFLFLIYLLGGLFDMIIIDFHWKGLHFSFVVKTFWHDWRKNVLNCFMLVWDHFVCVFINIFGLSLKTEIPFVRDHFVFYYEFVKELRSLYFCYKFVTFLYKYYFGMMSRMPSSLKVV